MTKTPLMDIVNAAAERFDKRPEYRASVEARAELKSTEPPAQAAPKPAATSYSASTEGNKRSE